MYCTSCGKQMEPEARFCSACGTAFSPASFYGAPFTEPPLTRPRHPRAIAGVCSGIALHYGWDVTFVRLIWALCVIFGGTGILAYIIAWIIIPEAPYAVSDPAFVANSGTAAGPNTGTTA
jgi:phage shock protein C